MCGLSFANVKREAEEQQLSSIAKYVAVKGMALVALAPADNVTSTVRLDVPSIVGNQRYWIQIMNDSSYAWVEVGFGTTVLSSNQRTYLPSELLVSGSYVSGSGAAFLECHSDGAGIHLTLYGGS